jgi:beta-glucosidase
MQDSPVGVRDTDYNSLFSSGQTVAATFDRSLMYARGYAMGQEHKGKGVTVQLGPVAGPIGRAPEGGRNWEGFSPDPVLTGIGMAQTIAGIQNHVVACAKHFIGKLFRLLVLEMTSSAPYLFMVILIIYDRLFVLDFG